MSKKFLIPKEVFSEAMKKTLSGEYDRTGAINLLNDILSDERIELLEYK